MRIDFVCRLELSQHCVAAAERKSECRFTQIEVKPLTSTSHFPLLLLPPSALKHLPTCPHTWFAAPPGAAPPPLLPPPKRQ